MKTLWSALEVFAYLGLIVGACAGLCILASEIEQAIYRIRWKRAFDRFLDRAEASRSTALIPIAAAMADAYISEIDSRPMRKIPEQEAEA